eukprot:355198-Chlamydomonas_euryale.AAC.2
MYRSFVLLAQEDTTQGQTYGLCCLFSFFKRRLAVRFDAAHLATFQDLAHRYYDYLSFDYGVRCLLEALTMGLHAAADAAGVGLDPLTLSMLSAWEQYRGGGTAEGGGDEVGSGGEIRGAAGGARASGGGNAALLGRLRDKLSEKRQERQRQRGRSVARDAPARRGTRHASADAALRAAVSEAAALAATTEAEAAQRSHSSHGGSGASLPPPPLPPPPPRPPAQRAGRGSDTGATSKRRYYSVVHKQMVLRAKAQPFMPAPRGNSPSVCDRAGQSAGG